MECKFQEKKLSCLQTLVCKSQVQEQTQQLRISDGMPDVGAVVGAWGQVILRSKEWNGDTLCVTGGTMVSVRYLPEQGGRAETVDSWIPFSLRWKVKEGYDDGVMLVQCSLKNVDARILSARKLLLRADVSVLLQGLHRQEKLCYEPSRVPEDVQLRIGTYPVLLTCDAGEKAFTIEEDLSLSAEAGKPVKLISGFLQPQVTEHRLLADKLVFRGNALLSVLWECEDGSCQSSELVLPFSQYTQLEAECDEDGQVLMWPAVTALETELSEEGIQVKAGIVCQYVVRARPVISIVQDAYSPLRDIQLRTQPLQLPGILESAEQSLQLRCEAEHDGSRPLMTLMYPQQIQQHRQDGSVSLQIPVRLQTLSCDGNNLIKVQNNKWEHRITLPVAEGCSVLPVLWPVGIVHSHADNTGMQLQTQLRLQLDTAMDTQLAMVTGLELGELTQPDPDRPSLILCRAGNTSLWELAKENGAMVQDIRKANGFAEEPEPGQLLLIPIR